VVYGGSYETFPEDYISFAPSDELNAVVFVASVSS
jgi:hypothetical protein